MRPEPAPKEFTTDNIVAMLIETNSQNNISSSLVKKSFENELANFYINSGKGARVQNVSALVSNFRMFSKYEEFVGLGRIPNTWENTVMLGLEAFEWLIKMNYSLIK